MLEIGMGTGKAAQPILDTHCHFVGIEPGENLAALAKERFRKYANFSLYNQTLQDYICADNSFDLVYAATAFHWIPEEYGYRRIYNLLKNGGVFARFAYHVIYSLLLVKKANGGVDILILIRGKLFAKQPKISLPDNRKKVVNLYLIAYNIYE